MIVHYMAMDYAFSSAKTFQLTPVGRALQTESKRAAQPLQRRNTTVADLRNDHPDNSGSQHPLVPAFDLDGMLGALAKWLRILGFDASYPCRTPSPGRVFVTTKRIAGRSDTIIVDERDSLDQLRQVLEQAGVAPDPDLFLSRCLICNVLVEEISRDRAAGRVPEQVLRAVSVFNECPECGRVYWEGSHSERIKKRLQKSGLG